MTAPDGPGVGADASPKLTSFNAASGPLPPVTVSWAAGAAGQRVQKADLCGRRAAWLAPDSESRIVVKATMPPGQGSRLCARI